ncbi:hypothetical protein HHL19_35585 [Streptomyces sp. R302]|uniref:hypothetical protein n=1 Tax=unclassified Streptomyces TaxID=2593676 RepID=UPI00145C7041|nr:MULTISPECIES: hypothetical protein [unclassified Streptomyces]NML55137.1 hypothetical protein [Streptomyces sp. R301]NML83833.1 hypothetical protein [Streptomyces sp. R302]
MSEQSIPTPRADYRPDVEFTPVSNGLDYLDSAVRHLEGRKPPNAYDLKYAVLHLHAATEVLLKVRLVKEHWSLVFADPGKATLQAYSNGSFASCTIADAVKRLEGVASLKISEDGKQAIHTLQRTRNGLTHFGHVESAHGVEAQAAAVLSFLLDFINTHLKNEPDVTLTMAELRARLQRIKRLVRDRMNQLSGVLKPLMHRTVRCIECSQWALVVGEKVITCRFCLYEYGEPAAAAVDYVLNIRYPGDLGQCKDCEELTLFKGRVASDKKRDRLICFACGVTYVHTGETVVISS